MEFRKAPKGILICKRCSACFYKKSWHHSGDQFISEHKKRDMPVSFASCPACWMEMHNQFEGKLIIKNFPEKQMTELFNLIRAYCKRAYLRDSQDRLIRSERGKGNAVLYFTENQLAMRLAKKIRDRFKRVEIRPHYAKKSWDSASIELTFRGNPAS